MRALLGVRLLNDKGDAAEEGAGGAEGRELGAGGLGAVGDSGLLVDDDDCPVMAWNDGEVDAMGMAIAVATTGEFSGDLAGVFALVGWGDWTELEELVRSIS